MTHCGGTPHYSLFHLCFRQPDAKGPRPEPLRQKEIEGKDPDAYDKMNALGLVRLEVSCAQP